MAERIVHSLGKHRWDFVLFDTPETDEWVKKAVQENRWSYPATGNFNWKYFEGDRKNYFRLYYDPVKVLQALGMVTHTSRGFTTRLIDEGDFDDQTRFAEMRIHQGEVEAELSAPEPPSDRGDILAWAKRM